MSQSRLSPPSVTKTCRAVTKTCRGGKRSSQCLVACRPGERCRLVGIDGGHRFVNRLMGLGLRIGAEVRVIQQRGQDVVLASAGNRIALGGSIARHLHVEQLQ